MASSYVRVRGSSIKFLDLLLVKYDEATMPSLDELEAHGYCVALGGTVLTIAAYETLCDELGGVSV